MPIFDCAVPRDTISERMLSRTQEIEGQKEADLPPLKFKIVLSLYRRCSVAESVMRHGCDADGPQY